MSRETVELVTGLQMDPNVDVAALFRDEVAARSLLDVVRPLYDPDFESVAVTAVEGERRYAGVDGLRAAWLDWLEPWESYRTEVEDVIDAGDGVVVVLVRNYGRRAGMDAEVSIDAAGVWTVRDGKIAHAAFYAKRSEALKAAGLPA